ncbi:MAG: chemotaxis protein CheW [Deltaproteobacteria bacterium]|nr:chemotaxis protein CheW [Deltaproteobacteria bacterium]
MKKYITFHIGSEFFGINVLRVQEINQPAETIITPIPRAPAHLKGILNLRGRMAPVIDLRQIFSLKSIEFDLNTRIIIIKFPDRLAGIVVDKVSGVIEIDQGKVEPLPVTISSIDAAHIDGIYKLDNQLITFLNIDSLIFPTSHKGHEEKRAHERIEISPLPEENPFSIQYKSKTRWVDAIALDISRSGIRILTDELLKQGKEIELNIIPKDKPSMPVHVKARVMWSRDIENSHNAGIMFLNMTEKMLNGIGLDMI